jgi:hypothetical protein
MIEPTEADIARVIARAARLARHSSLVGTPNRRRRLAAPALATLALLAGGIYAVPAARAAIDDVAGTFAGWLR